MTGEAVLIAAYSGRALAQSARRAGFVPLVADAFGDLDMRDAAHAFEIVPNVLSTGFRARPLIAALDRLAAQAASKPIGIVMGSGLEDKPQLWDLLDKRYGVLGCNAETVRSCKDPRIFFQRLKDLGIPHPEWGMDPPADPDRWISKRVGGSGGRHIRFATSEMRAHPGRYFQNIVDGERISVTLASGDALASRQWCSPTQRMPYRYGGATRVPVDADTQYSDLANAAGRIARVLNVRGLASFDFVVSEDRYVLLEVNPRPGASHDVHDDDHGGLFAAHIASSRAAGSPAYDGPRTGSRSAAILHADRGALTLGHIDWPDWSADRGPPGTDVPEGAPLATVFANAPSSDAAEALARERLAILQDLIYGQSTPIRE